MITPVLKLGVLVHDWYAPIEARWVDFEPWSLSLVGLLLWLFFGGFAVDHHRRILAALRGCWW